MDSDCSELKGGSPRSTVANVLDCNEVVKFGLIGFDVISTIVGYLMPNPVYTYLLDIYEF